MVVYNFQRRFADPIAAGTKTHTIRRNGKRRHARPGEELQLYTGLRTKAAAKIIVPDPVCIDALTIAIDVREDTIASIAIKGFPIQELENFAKSDGFLHLKEMHEFFLRMHGPGVFHGTLIEWRRTGG